MACVPHKSSYLWLASDGRVLAPRSSSLLWSLLPSELMSSRDSEMEGSRPLKRWSADRSRGGG